MFHIRQMQARAMISVIIPYYNPDNDSSLQELLQRAISSVVPALDDKETIQILVVDDGSPVPPRDVVKGFNDIRISLIEIAHAGLGAARNSGIAKADGDIIAFIDADDYYFPDILGQCVTEMRRTDADLFSFNLKICTGGTIRQPQGNRIRISAPVSGNDYMSRHTPFGSCCRFLISKELLTHNSLKFAENTYMEDEDFTPRLLFFSERYVQSDATAYAYCLRDGSITTSPLYDKRATDTINVLKRLQDFRQAHSNERCDGIDRKICWLAMDHIRRTLRRPDWRKAFKIQCEALSALGLWPLRYAPYGMKYQLFTLLSKCRTGIRLLQINERRYIR